MTVQETSDRQNKSEEVSLSGKVDLKGEIHSSRADFRRERELMSQGVDALVVEGAEQSAEYGITEGWFQQAMSGMSYILSPLYVSKQSLVDMAKFQDAEVHYTRESDASVLRNSPFVVRLLTSVIYYLLMPTSVILGLVTDSYLTGAGLLAASFFIPVLTIRVYNTRLGQNGHTRDQIIAESIANAARDNDRVLAVVGDAHAEGVIDNIPDEIQLRYHPPEYDVISISHFKEILVPLFQTFSLLLTLYLTLLFVFMNAGFVYWLLVGML